MDVGTAYDRRIKDDAFALKWAAALEKAKSRPSPARGRGREELVLRRTKHGDKMVRAAAGRWNAKAEATFRAALRRTGCVRAAARACGFSTTTLYNRRETYPDFAASWAADEAFARERLPGLLSAAAIAALDPEIDDEALPKVNVDQAIAIVRMKGGGTAVAKAGRYKKPEISIEQARDEVIQRIAAIKRHRERTGEQGPALPDGEER
jgi:hypothetical protein